MFLSQHAVVRFFFVPSHSATAELTANGDTYAIRGFIWHQGESDDSNAVAGTGRAGRYLNNFSNLIDGVRAHVGIADLPVVIGELSQSRTSTNNDAFRALQVQVASSLNRVGFASSVGLTTPLSTGNGAGVNSIGGSADGDSGAAFVDSGETLILTLNFDETMTTAAVAGITFRSLGNASDSATTSIAGGPEITLHDDVSGGQVANTTFTFAADAFNISEPVPLASGATIVFTNVAAGENYQITGLTLEIGTPSAPGLTGDFDDDGDVDLDDINHYVGNLGTNAAGETAELDLNGDAEITFADAQLHIETYVQTNNG